MTDAITSYGAVLLTMHVDSETVDQAKEIVQTYPPLIDALENPTVPENEKFAVIDKLFPEALRAFVKVVCQNGRIGEINSIFAEYEDLLRRQNDTVKAVIEYVTPLSADQLDAMRQLVQKKTGKNKVEIETHENKDLIGGFVLRIGDETVDRSVATAAKRLRKTLTHT